MSTPPRLQGLLAPVVTPFQNDMLPDAGRFARHCRWLLDSGCAGLAIFGTNSEANSLSAPEKIELMNKLVADGIPGAKLMPGTGACSVPEAAQLTTAAVKLGAAGVLMLPPFFYKGVSDEGLFRYYSQVIENVGDSALRVYLYHIPPVSQVPISLPLIERLVKAYPDTVVGLKDSSGDWNYSKSVIDAFASTGFDVFPASETLLLRGLRAGGKGCITATGNINPGPISRLYDNWQGPDAEALQQKVSQTRELVQKYPMIPALKAVIAYFSQDPAWRAVRPPLTDMPGEQEAELIGKLEELGFDMPGIR
ncbi:dihydrodipicolinate synthase family protein [Pigmentiphaga sp. NML080357]|uniref:dihydrodipicolinate synthase family protein n=1 Tax=Pigmentiphaga sp. NML080357 TaxID=2008675 RepID=UPI000B40CD4A|nr:dihydrodipicolinate synthase family protein [Pigmentiphaga sp. NML080357]OVZ57232.1 dihydrodipicolinate synthase family protein [Pigmentiphaga sp. NML080357]